MPHHRVPRAAGISVAICVLTAAQEALLCMGSSSGLCCAQGMEGLGVNPGSVGCFTHWGGSGTPQISALG